MTTSYRGSRGYRSPEKRFCGGGLVQRMSIGAVLILLGFTLCGTALALPKVTTHTGKLVKTGATGFTPGTAMASESSLNVRSGLEVDHFFEKLQGSGNQSPARVSAAHVPKPSGNDIVLAPSSVLSFDALTERQQALASGSVIEPPDQALAVGNGYVLEGVNLAFAVYDANSGVPLTPAVGLNAFFHLAPNVFTSDPKAIYDAQTGHWFVSTLAINPSYTQGSVLIAVSQTSDPTGAYNIYELDTTDTGVSGCPCFGDQPLIGADAAGIYVDTNQFGLANGRFVGNQIFAVDKAGLAAGASSVNTEALLLPAVAYPVFYSLQPATVPPGGQFATSQGGTEYFLGSLDDFNTLTNRIAVLALTNTSSLAAASSGPDLHLQAAILGSEVYGPPPSSEQPLVPVSRYETALPLAYALRTTLGAAYGGPFNDHEELTDANDDRMNQVVFADGKLFGALDTVVKTRNGPATAGVAWFAVVPAFDGDTLKAVIAHQGYVSVDGQNVNYPSIGMNAAGKGIMSFTVVGNGYAPSAAYAPINASGEVGDVHILAEGMGPDDGFSGYLPFGNRVARWGDYSAAVADESGAIWLATEYIPNEPRLIYANWGTRISKVVP
jgi:hypothetical protein